MQELKQSMLNSIREENYNYGYDDHDDDDDQSSGNNDLSENEKVSRIGIEGREETIQKA